MMKLLRLPFLARERIFKEMGISELLLLSFVSKRTRNAIREIRLKSTETCFKLGNDDGTDSLAYGIFISHELGTHAIKWRFKEDSDDVEWEKVTINGNSFECSFEFDHGIPKMWIKDSIRTEFPFIIHSHFYNLFQLSTEIRVSAPLDTFEEFPNIRRVHSLFIEPKNQNVRGCMTKLNAVLNSIEITDHLQIHPYCPGKLSDEIQIWKIKSIKSYWGMFFTGEHFLKFEGENLFLSDPEISLENIRTFIREWIEGEKFGRVESVSLFFHDIPPNEDITTEQLLEGFDSKPFDPERRPAVLEHTDSMRRHLSKDRTNLREGWDIERTTDGRLATVVNRSTAFYFFVWPEEIIRNHQQNLSRLYE